jgi:hypothetical protein
MGWTGMETQTMVERLSIFVHNNNNNKKTNKILDVRLEGLFWAGYKVGCSFFLFGLWAWPLEASHYVIPNQRLQFLYFIGYFQPISLDSQHILVIQSHNLVSWMVIVWSGPKVEANIFVEGVIFARQYQHTYLHYVLLILNTWTFENLC